MGFQKIIPYKNPQDGAGGGGGLLAPQGLMDFQKIIPYKNP